MTPMERYLQACNYPGMLDVPAVQRHLADYCGALGVTRQIVRLAAGWRLADHPSLARSIRRVLDEFAYNDGSVRAALEVWAALEARPALGALATREAHAARTTQAALAARDSRTASARAALVALVARGAPTEAAARDARGALHGPQAEAARDRFARWCIQAKWPWQFEMSWLATIHVGAARSFLSGELPWSAPFFEAFIAGAWLLHWTDDTLYWAAKPRVHLVSAGGRQRLHNPSGAALESDVEDLYFLDGVLVPELVVMRPGCLTIEHIHAETNAEVRRRMLERYGLSRYITDCDAEVVDSVPMDHPLVGLRGARLLRKELRGEPEPIVYLDMLDSTMQPDGSRKHHLERIDPKAYAGDAGRLCHAAMASRWRYRDDAGQLQLTFASWQEYRPTAES